MKSTTVACLITAVLAGSYGPRPGARCRATYKAYMGAEPGNKAYMEAGPSDTETYVHYVSDPFMAPVPTQAMAQDPFLLAPMPTQPMSQFPPMPSQPMPQFPSMPTQPQEPVPSQTMAQDPFQAATVVDQEPSPTRVITQIPLNRPQIQSTYKPPPKEKPTTIAEEDPVFM